MSKFKIKVKLTGFELEIEGDRQDIPALTRSVSKQLGGMVAPPSADMFEDAEVVSSTPAQVALPEASKPAPKKKKVSGSKGKSSTPSKSDGSTALELDGRGVEGKYSSPLQDWPSSDKLLWLLYVLEKEYQVQSATSAQLKDTFNKYFRSVGEINAQNVADLRKKVIAKPSLIGKDTSVEPVAWYLKDAGKRHVESLIEHGTKDIA